MTTPLLRKAYGLNQEINDRVISYPLKYDQRANKWVFDFKGLNSRTSRIHLLMYIFQGISTALLGIVLLYVVAYLRGVLKTFQVLVGSLLFLTLFNGFVMDLIAMVYGNEIADCVNATFELANICPGEIRDMAAKLKRDFTGLLALYIVIGGTLSGFLIPVLIVANNLDPIYTLILVAQNMTHFSIINTIDLSCWILIVIRCFLGTLASLVVMAGLRTMVLINLGAYPVIINHLRKLSSVKLDKTSLQMYLKACIVFNATKHIIKIFTISVVSSVFFVIVIGANGTILFASLRKHPLSMLCGAYTITIIFAVITLFNISDKMYFESRNLLLKWDKEALPMKSYGGLFVKKTVKSLRAMVIPMGTVGTMDKHAKNDYLEEVLNYILNVLVMVNKA